MNNMFKVLKADVQIFFRTRGERDLYRPNGDCSFRSLDEKK